MPVRLYSQRNQALIDAFLIDRTLNDTTPEVRDEAGISLGRSEADKAALLRVLEDTGADVEKRVAAARGIERAQFRAATDALLQQLTVHAPQKLTEALVNTLVQLFDSDIEKKLLDQLLSAPQDLALEHLIGHVAVLVRATGERVLDTFEQWYEETALEEAIRIRSLQILKGLSSSQPSVTSRLLRLATQTEEEALRILAAITAHSVAADATVTSLGNTLRDTTMSQRTRESAAVNLAFLEDQNADTCLRDVLDSSDSVAVASTVVALQLRDMHEEAGLFPHPVERTIVRLDALMAEKCWHLALINLNELIVTVPESGMLHSMRARCHFELDESGSALSDAMKAMDLGLHTPAEWVEHGDFLCQMKRWKEAEVAYRSALELDENHAWAIARLGDLAGQEGRLDVAEELLRQAIALGPKESLFALYLADLLFRTEGRSKEAAAEYRRALDLDENCSWAVAALGILAEQEGQLEAAEELFRKAIDLNPKQPLFARYLGSLLSKSETRWKDAEAAFREGLTFAPDDSALLNALAWHLVSQSDRLEEARQLARRAVEFCTDTSVWHTLVEIELRLNSPDVFVTLDRWAALCTSEEIAAMRPAWKETLQRLCVSGRASRFREIAAQYPAWERWLASFACGECA